MRAMAGQYHTFPQVVDILETLADDYPDIVKLDTIGQSYEGNQIFLLKISDNVDIEEEEEEQVLFVALHHAREWPSLEVALFIADSLASSYGVVPEITDIIDSQQIWIVPCLNPDGYIYSHDLGHDWRKNRHHFPEWNSYGVDLNRNWGGSNDGNPIGQWGSVQGSISNNPDQSVYCGPGPKSELETRALWDFASQREFIFMVTYHTHGELILYPWGYTHTPNPDDALISSIAEEMASRISGQYSGHYNPQPSSDLYPTTGDAVDHYYGWNLNVGGSNTVPFTVEIGESFQPSPSYLDQIVRENWDGAYYLLGVAETVRSLFTPKVMSPDIDPMGINNSGDYTVSWEESNPAAEAGKYQLDELTGYGVNEDDAESGSGLWNLEGFTMTSSRSHSPTRSYYSTTQTGNQSVIMKTQYPYFVHHGDSLTFWCWYDTEYLYDYAFVEVSEQGKQWDLLSPFNGSQMSWQRQALSLEDYVGRWIFIQFRYITDDNIEEPGFYVDDIHPVPDFDEAFTLSNNILDEFYEITGRGNGKYYYRVKGHNNARGWGDFSQLKYIKVSRAVFHKDPHEF